MRVLTWLCLVAGLALGLLSGGRAVTAQDQLVSAVNIPDGQTDEAGAFLASASSAQHLMMAFQQPATSTATLEPTDTPEPPATPPPAETPQPTATPPPTRTPQPTDTPEPPATPPPAETPRPTDTPLPTATPQPTATSRATATPRSTEIPRPRCDPSDPDSVCQGMIVVFVFVDRARGRGCDASFDESAGDYPLSDALVSLLLPDRQVRQVTNRTGYVYLSNVSLLPGEEVIVEVNYPRQSRGALLIPCPNSPFRKVITSGNFGPSRIAQVVFRAYQQLPSPTPTATPTIVSTPATTTPSPTPTPTPTATPTPTPSPAPTDTPTPSPAPTNTPAIPEHHLYLPLLLRPTAPISGSE